MIARELFVRAGPSLGMCVGLGLFHAAYEVAGTSPDPLISRLWTYATASFVILAILSDARSRREGAVFDLGTFLFFTFPLGPLWYLCRTHGRWGFSLFVSGLLLFVLTMQAAVLVGQRLRLH
jgi:hypothetical protein